MASGPGWQARMNTALTAPSLPHSARCCQLLSVGCATRNLMLNKSVPFFLIEEIASLNLNKKTDLPGRGRKIAILLY
ncbi:hypothetical protein ACXX81_15180 [Pseudomonas sp. GNP013]